MAIAIGNVKIRKGIIHNVLHVPLIKKNLLYVDALDIIGIKVVFSKGLCELWKGKSLFLLLVRVSQPVCLSFGSR